MQVHVVSRRLRTGLGSSSRITKRTPPAQPCPGQARQPPAQGLCHSRIPMWNVTLPRKARHPVSPPMNLCSPPLNAAFLVLTSWTEALKLHQGLHAEDRALFWESPFVQEGFLKEPQRWRPSLCLSPGKPGAVERVGIRVWGKAGLGAANQPQPVPQGGAEAGPEGQAPSWEHTRWAGPSSSFASGGHSLSS